ncbi:MAG: tetratricopeptide repeat protein [Alphaproteobacteria bacterium]
MRIGFLPALFVCVLIIQAAGRTQAQEASTEPSLSPSTPTVFQMPALRAADQQILALYQAGKLEQAKTVLDAVLKRYPELPDPYFARAVVLIGLGKQSEALADLETAVSHGYNNVTRLKTEPSFEKLRDNQRFSALVLQAGQNPATMQSAEPPKATLVRDGIALVSAANTHHEPRTNTLQAAFEFRSRLFTDPKVMAIDGPVADRLNDLYRRGKAAGNNGDLYDNRDRGHSTIRSNRYPQIGFVKYDPGAIAENIDFSFNDKIFFSAPTIGNASLGINGMWSVVKAALTNPRLVALAYLQFRTDHLYVYPCVRDYGWPDTMIDNFMANTPYLIISKGKSGSDRPFIRAGFVALAAMPPDVKALAKESGLIAPTVQMLIRRGQIQVNTIEDYLSPIAHPVVFDGEKLDMQKIIDVAQSLTVENLPPRVEFTILKENSADPSAQQAAADHLFTTPGAAARIVPNQGGSKTMTVSLANTVVPSGKQPTYHWRILEGNPDLISIRPRNETGSVAELEFKWQARQPSLANPEVQTDRADVGMFVEIDGMISAPAIISVYFPKK